MRFAVNDSPLAGREGSKVTSRMIRDRLLREAETNVAIRVTESEDKDSFEVAGRGELQLGVLIETMRREGFELGISRPRVLFREEDGKRMEPYETVVIDVDDEHSGTVVEKMQRRKADLAEMRPSGVGKTRITFSAPSRGSSATTANSCPTRAAPDHEPPVRKVRPLQARSKAASTAFSSPTATARRWPMR